MIGTLALAAPAGADTRAENATHTFEDPSGDCYARSIPAKRSGSAGRTLVYRIADGRDELLHTFRWYSHRIDIDCDAVGPEGRRGIALVRHGDWPRGREAKRKDLALAFYFDGETLAEHSTLALAGYPRNVSTVSHYRVIESTRLDRATGLFHVLTVDGRELTFDIGTGQLEAPPT
ncbi:MAG: hypothetical protein R3244_01555 [Thermoanaerobaculia bacterium]|nr:hypothetical protein [Thermoanaerobaculia bacterium]